MSFVHSPCRVCDRDNANFLFEKSGWTIVRCQNCGFIYTDPIPAKENLQRYYSSGIKIDWRKGKNLHIIEDFSVEKVKRKFTKIKPFKSPRGRIWIREMRLTRWNKYLPQVGRFLDVGCGQGHLLIAAKKRRKWDCIGVDIQIHMLRQARALDPNANIYVATADELCFKDETFDIITVTHLLEHTFDPLNTLRELSRALRKKGVLVVTVPNIAHPFARLRGKNWRRINPPGHLWYFSPQTLARLVEKANMEVVHEEKLLLRSNLTVFGRKG